jgi:hypothetical protein
MPAPPVLYRNPQSWELSQSLTDQKDINFTDPTGQTTGDYMPISLSSLTLSWFGPDHSTDIPPTPGEAWLVPQLNSFTYDNSDTTDPLCFDHPLPTSDITLTVPGLASIQATDFPGLGTDRPRRGVGRGPGRSRRRRRSPTEAAPSVGGIRRYDLPGGRSLGGADSRRL